MRSLIAVTAIAVTSLLAPEIASADRADCSKGLEHKYTTNYKKVVKLHGKRAPGRNIRRDGVRYIHKKGAEPVVFNATCGEIRRSNRQLKRLRKSQPYSTLVTTAIPPRQPPAGTLSQGVDGNQGAGGWAIPEYIVMCESGGSYTASNASGAYGAYQIMPGTAAAYGCDLSTPSGQDVCAAKIYAAQGSAPWTCG